MINNIKELNAFFSVEKLLKGKVLNTSFLGLNKINYIITIERDKTFYPRKTMYLIKVLKGQTLIYKENFKTKGAFFKSSFIEKQLIPLGFKKDSINLIKKKSKLELDFNSFKELILRGDTTDLYQLIPKDVNDKKDYALEKIGKELIKKCKENKLVLINNSLSFEDIDDSIYFKIKCLVKDKKEETINKKIEELEMLFLEKTYAISFY